MNHMISVSESCTLDSTFVLSCVQIFSGSRSDKKAGSICSLSAPVSKIGITPGLRVCRKEVNDPRKADAVGVKRTTAEVFRKDFTDNILVLPGNLHILFGRHMSFRQNYFLFLSNHLHSILKVTMKIR